MATAGLADWLALHCCSAEQMLTLRIEVLARVGPAPSSLPDLPSAEAVWAMAAEALTVAFPDESALIARARDHTSRNLAADPARFPRAFTLWQPPYVSCPAGLAGMRKLLTIAHEFGHACQIGACGAQPPPILREIAAYLAELAFLDHLAQVHPALHQDARTTFDATTQRLAAGAGQRLRAVLIAGEGTYRYDWNYPPARAVAMKLWHQADRTGSWAAFEGASLALLKTIGDDPASAPGT